MGNMQWVVFHSAFPPWRARANYFPASGCTYVRTGKQAKRFLDKIVKHGTKKRMTSQFFRTETDFNTRGKNQQFKDDGVKLLVSHVLWHCFFFT